MALAQAMAVASIGKPDAVALIEARVALLTALQENDDTTKRIVSELRYIEGISQGQVKRVASNALKSIHPIDTSQERVEKEREIKRIGCVQHDCAECKAREAQPAREPLTDALLAAHDIYKRTK